MVLHGMDTPRGGDSTVIHDFEHDFPSMEASFQSPGLDRNVLAGMNQANNNRTRNRRGQERVTPRRPGLFGGANNKPTGRQEFTPLLKSIQKNQMRNKMRGGTEGTPDFFDQGKYGNSPSLPGNSTNGDSYADDADTTIGQSLPNSSGVSSPMELPKRRDSGGVLQQDGQMMTLREQERVCFILV